MEIFACRAFPLTCYLNGFYNLRVNTKQSKTMVMDIFTLQSYADIDTIRYVAICIALMLFLPMWMYWDKDSVIFVGEVLRCK